MAANIPEGFPFIYYVCANVPLPFGVIGVLVLGFGTDMVPAIALGYERSESDIMKREPRNPFTDRMCGIK